MPLLDSFFVNFNTARLEIRQVTPADRGDLKGHWSLTVNANWRMVFTFEGDDAVLVDYRDYH